MRNCLVVMYPELLFPNKITIVYIGSCVGLPIGGAAGKNVPSSFHYPNESKVRPT